MSVAASRRYVLTPTRSVRGELSVPGDKSISHRALMLGGIAEGRTDIEGFLASEDCLATLTALRALGVAIERPAAQQVCVHGAGRAGLRGCVQALDMGNAGTAIRLFMGLLAGQDFDSTLVGDASLMRRPMERVAQPLRAMGAQIDTLQGRPPVRLRGGARLHAIDYDMPIASAQVKSAVLLAGLYAAGRSSVTEPAPTRDHTERMLRGFGVEVQREAARVSLEGGARLQGCAIAVPGDFSSAAFFLVAGCLAATQGLTLRRVGVNPTRTGLLELLTLMGIFFIAAAAARGETLVTGAAELRVKESDRLAVMAEGLQAVGVECELLPDGMRIQGGVVHGGRIDSHGDHRIAMAFAIASLLAQDSIEIDDVANVATSFPGFVQLACSAGLALQELP